MGNSNSPGSEAVLERSKPTQPDNASTTGGLRENTLQNGDFVDAADRVAVNPKLELDGDSPQVGDPKAGSEADLDRRLERLLRDPDDPNGAPPPGRVNGAGPNAQQRGQAPQQPPHQLDWPQAELSRAMTVGSAVRQLWLQPKVRNGLARGWPPTDRGLKNILRYDNVQEL